MARTRGKEVLLHGSASAMAASQIQGVPIISSHRLERSMCFGATVAVLPSRSPLSPWLPICRIVAQGRPQVGREYIKGGLHSAATRRMQRDDGSMGKPPASADANADAISNANAKAEIVQGGTNDGWGEQEWQRLLSLTGSGQHRPHLCSSLRREWTDPHMASHVAFVPAILLSCSPSSPLPELAALQSIVLILSLLYHHNYERPGALARAEGVFAKALFLYGTVQTCYSPTDALRLANGACFAVTAGTFIATNLDKSLYERWHPLGLHVVPGLWATLVALFNTSLLPPAVVAELLQSFAGV